MERPKILPHEEHKKLAARSEGSLHPDCSATTWKVEKRVKKGRWKHHGYQAKEADARRDMNALVAEGWYGARFHRVKKSLNEKGQA